MDNVRFNMEKKLKSKGMDLEVVTNKKVRAYIPKNTHPFVMVSIFVCKAKLQGWTDEEVQKIRLQAKQLSPSKVRTMLECYMSNTFA